MRRTSLAHLARLDEVAVPMLVLARERARLHRSAGLGLGLHHSTGQVGGCEAGPGPKPGPKPGAKPGADPGANPGITAGASAGAKPGFKPGATAGSTVGRPTRDAAANRCLPLWRGRRGPGRWRQETVGTRRRAIMLSGLYEKKSPRAGLHSRAKCAAHRASPPVSPSAPSPIG